MNTNYVRHISRLAPALLLALTMSVAHAQRSGMQTQQQREGQVQPPLRLSAGEIADNPHRFYGQRVTVRAEVDEVFGQGVFSLDDDRWFRGGDVLVVIHQRGVRTPPSDSVVTVTGTLNEFVAAQAYRDYGWLRWLWEDTPDLRIEWDRRPLIVAESIRTETGQELLGPDRQQPRASQPAAQQRQILNVSASDLASDPQQYFGRTIRVRSEVEETFSPHAFSLDDQQWLWFRGTDPLVLVQHPARAAAEGWEVTVVGTVRPFNVRQLQRDYDWFHINLLGNADDVRQWERDERPVLIAQSVRTDTGFELVQRGGQQDRTGIGGLRDQTMQRGSGAGGGGDQPISNIRLLFQRDPMQLVGNQVDFHQAQVQRVVNQNWIMIGSAREQQVLVRVPWESGDIRIGDTVRLSGVLRQMPDSPNQIGLSQRQVNLAELQDLYINATRIELLN
jgi:hypothetical protein